MVIWIAGSTGNTVSTRNTVSTGNAGSTAVNRGVVKEAQSLFWQYLHKLVKEKYKLQAVQAVDKLTRAYIDAATSEYSRKLLTQNV